MQAFTWKSLKAKLSPEQRRRLRPLKPLAQLLFRIARPARLGILHRTTPLSESFGYDRGSPVDRYYIEHFLAEHRRDIRGRALEVEDRGSLGRRYVERYGVGVERRDVLDIDPTNPFATITADLAAADSIPSDQFDCFVLTQVLQFVYDTRAALAEAHRILRPGGVLLVTVPATTRVDNSNREHSDFWRFTVDSCTRLFGEAFGAENIAVRSYGNVLACIAFLTGLAHQELSPRELQADDQNFPLIIAVRAVKSGA